MSDLSSTGALNLRSEQHAWQSPPQLAGAWQPLHTAVGGSWTAPAQTCPLPGAGTSGCHGAAVASRSCWQYLTVTCVRVQEPSDT